MKFRKALTLLLLSCLLISLTSPFLGVLPVHATTVFGPDGWENSGGTSVTDNGAWTGSSGTCSVVTSPVHTGTYAAEIAGVSIIDHSQYIYKTLSSSYSTLYYREYVYFSSLISASKGLQGEGIATIDPTGSQVPLLFAEYDINSSGTYWAIWDNVNSVKHFALKSTINAGQWYCVEMEGVAGSNGGATLWVNGVQMLTFTANMGSHTLGGVECHNEADYASTTNYYDDCVASTSYIGPMGGWSPYQYVTQTSTANGVTTIGTHSSFASEQSAPDGTYDTLTEGNTATYSTSFGNAPSSPSSSQYATQAANTMNGTKFTSGSSVSSITLVCAYLRSSSGTTKAKAVVLDSSLHIISNGISNENASISTTARWYRFTFANNPSISASTAYYLSIISGSSSVRFCASATTGGASFGNSSNSESSPQSPAHYYSYSNGYNFEIYANTTGTPSYQIDLEEEWTNTNQTSTTNNLCIYMGSCGEELAVQIWHGSWTTLTFQTGLAYLTANSWNNVSVSSYITYATNLFIRFINTTSTTAQYTWQLDCVVLYTNTLGAVTGLTCRLNAPANNAKLNPSTIKFNFTATSINSGAFKNASLWSNYGGSWAKKANNSTAVNNGTITTISYAMSTAGTYLWNVKVFNSTYGCFATSNFTITIQSSVITVGLNAPSNGASFASSTIKFNFTATSFNAGSFKNASLWSNYGGTWALKASNNTAVHNGTITTISYAMSTIGTYLWNVKVWNSTKGVFAASNFTISVSSYSVLFSDSFQSGSFSAWNGTDGTSTVESSITYTGCSYAGNFTQTSSSDESTAYKFLSPQTELCVRAYIYFTGLPSAGTVMEVSPNTDTGTSFANHCVVTFVQINNTGSSYIWQLGYTDPSLTLHHVYSNSTVVPIQKNTWYCVENDVYWGTSGWGKLYVNGLLVASFSNFNDVIEGEPAPNLIIVGICQSPVGVHNYVDDVVAATSYIGPVAAITVGTSTCSSAVAGASCTFSVTVSTTAPSLADYRFAWANGTVAMTNSSWFAFPSGVQSYQVSISKKLNITVGSPIKYEWYFNDSAGNKANTGLQSFTTTSTPTPPKFSGSTYSTTNAGTSCTFTISITDNVGLTYYRFDFRNGGSSYTNGTWTAISGSPNSYTASVTPTLIATKGATVYWRWEANNTAEQMNSTSPTMTLSLTTTDTLPPKYSSLSFSTQVAGQSCTFSVTVSDNVGLSKYMFAFGNGTLTPTNGTWVSLTANPQSVGVSKKLDTTAGETISYRWFFNDTSGNCNSTAILTFQTTSSSSLFSYSFESGNLSNWTGGQGIISVVTTYAHTGSYSAYSGTSSSSWEYKNLASTYSTLYYQTWMYWPTLPSNGGEQDFIGIFTGNRGTGTAICYASIGNNAGQMYWSLYNNVVGADHTSSATINAGVWYQVQMAGYVSSTVGFMTLWVNGNLIMNITKQNLGSTNVGTVQLTTDGVAVGQYWDDITVATSYITSAGNTGVAEYVDNVVAATSYVGPATSPPTYSGLSASPQVAGSTCTFSITVSDVAGLSKYRFAFANGTVAMTNSS